MANSRARKRSSKLAQRVRGAERRAGAVELSEIAGMAAAGHYVGDEDDLPVNDGFQMFPDDIDTGLGTEETTSWSFGPPMK